MNTNTVDKESTKQRCSRKLKKKKNPEALHETPKRVKNKI
jgi:hypothetical protein